MDFKIISFFVIMACASDLSAQQSFTPIVFELTSTSPTYTVPNDSILKVESIGIIYPTNMWLSTGNFIVINNQTITWLEDGQVVLKFPFWLPSGSTIAPYGNAYEKYQVYGLLFPK
jgi:hypothetical protein